MLGNTSLILGKDGKLYVVGAKKVLIFNEKDSEKNKILKWRCRIPSQKKNDLYCFKLQKCFCYCKWWTWICSWDNTKCQIANNTSALFSEWTQMALTGKCKRFIQCRIAILPLYNWMFEK